jgi:hypothetical protein
MIDLAEAALADAFVPRELAEPTPAVATFLCAVCVREVNCVPTREPFGRDGAMVNVCASCISEQPKQGSYSFGR